MLGILPFANIHDELVAALLEVDTALNAPTWTGCREYYGRRVSLPCATGPPACALS